MATESLGDYGIYVGTTTGQLFYSRGNSDNCELMMVHFPLVLSIECGIAV